MITYFQGLYGQTDKIDPDYRLNMIFTHELDEDHVLITTPERPWVILEREEYDLLVDHKIETRPDVYRTLHDLGIIITQNNVEDISKRYASKYSFMFEPPTLNIIVLTNRCNMACTYCHAEVGSVRDHHLDMSEELAMKTIDFFFSIPPATSRHKTIEFQGGETLLRWDLMQKVMDYAMEKAREQEINLTFAIVSNMTVMTDEIAEEVKRRGNINLCTSVDGPAELHNKERVFPGGNPTYEQTMYWVERLKDVHGLGTGMLPTCSTNHIGHEKEMVDFFTEEASGSMYVRTMNRTGYAHKNDRYDSLGMSSEQSLEFWQKSLDLTLEKAKRGELVKEHSTIQLLKNMLNVKSQYMCMRSPCGAATSQLTVGESGTIHACDAGRSIDMLVLGNVMEHTYEDIINSDIAQALRSVSRETMPKCNTCAFSPYCQYCFVKAANVEGSPITKIPMDHQCETFITMIPHLFKKFLDKEEAEVLSSWATTT